MKKLFKQIVIGMTLGMVLSLPMTAHASDDEFRIQYKVGDGLYIGNGENMVHFQSRVAGRFTYNALSGGAADTDNFTIPRGELRIDGHLLDKLLLYGFEMNMATRARATTATVCATAACAGAGGTASAVTTESTTGLATMNDYYLDWLPSSYIAVKVGQFKVPFLMQQLTSSTKQQFVDRSLGTSFFDFTRDIGVNIHGTFIGHGATYNLFFMNGDGPNTINRNQGLLTGVRFDVPIVGDYVASESDIDDSPEPNFGVGLAYAFNEGVSAFTNSVIPANAKASHGTIDAGFKYKGWSVQAAGMINRSHEVAKHTNLGFNGQVGYFVIPKKVEIAGRASGAIFSDAVANQYEYALGLNYFFKGHGIKVQTDVAELVNTRVAGKKDQRVRTQLQFIF